MSTGGSRRAVFAALLANLGIAVAKFVGFFFTRSSSMLAEGVHSLADTGNQLLLLLGGHRAKKQPTAVHPFGYGRERYFWAFVVSIVLFALGSMFAIFEGVEKLLHPHELESPQWAIGILLVAVVLEASSFRTAVRESNPLRRGASWPEFIRRSKAPELPVLLLEDSGALIGLVVALIAVVLSVVTGSGIWDGVGSTLIGMLLGVIAVVLATEMKSLLIGESASESDERAIVGAIEGDSQVRSLIHLRTEHIGPEELLVGAKIDFDPALSMRDLAVAIDAVEAAIRGTVPSARVIYIEPDIARSTAADPIDADEPPAD
ncbi:MAG: cation diffusion facilitator family transporter [Acidimicrobiales bacterium]